MSDKKTDKINNLQEEFNKIQDENKDFDPNMYLAKLEDLPELGDIQIYDYDSDVHEVTNRAKDVLDSLADLFLGDVPKVVDHPYIQNKLREDAQVYAQTLFLIKMTRKVFISQMRQIDNGSNGARDYEVLNQTMGQYRENIKFSNTHKTDFEKFYKDIRKDLGLNEMEPKVVEQTKVDEQETKTGGMIIDSRTMNEMIANALKK
jgi:hypothetical protein